MSQAPMIDLQAPLVGPAKPTGVPLSGDAPAAQAWLSLFGAAQATLEAPSPTALEAPPPDAPEGPQGLLRLLARVREATRGEAPTATPTQPVIEPPTPTPPAEGAPLEAEGAPDLQAPQAAPQIESPEMELGAKPPEPSPPEAQPQPLEAQPEARAAIALLKGAPHASRLPAPARPEATPATPRPEAALAKHAAPRPAEQPPRIVEAGDAQPEGAPQARPNHAAETPAPVAPRPEQAAAVGEPEVQGQPSAAAEAYPQASATEPPEGQEVAKARADLLTRAPEGPNRRERPRIEAKALVEGLSQRLGEPRLSPKGRLISRVHQHTRVDPQTRAEILRQVSDSLRLRGDGGVQRAELQLRPADLGLVQVQMQMEQGALRVIMLAEQPMTQAALQSGREQLCQFFVAQGLLKPQVEVRRAPKQQKRHERAEQPQKGRQKGRLDLRI